MGHARNPNSLVRSDFLYRIQFHKTDSQLTITENYSSPLHRAPRREVVLVIKKRKSVHMSVDITKTKGRALARAIAAVTTLLATCIGAEAQATTITVGDYAAIYQLVEEATATVNGVTASVVAVDLSAPGISFTTTTACSTCSPGGSSETLGQQTSAFMQSTGVQVAVDANQYVGNSVTANPLALNGLAVSNGTLVSSDQSGYEAVLISKSNQVVMASGGSVSSLNGVYNAVAGQQGLILSSGVNQELGTSVAQRVGLGVSANDQYMYLVTS